MFDALARLKWKPCGHVEAAELPGEQRKNKNLLPPLMPLL